MGSIQLVMACDAPELALLKEGTTRLGELEIEVQHVHPRERHKKMAQSLAFDICEYSLVDYLNSFDRGLSFTAVPVFPHRVFRHRDIWVSSASGVTEPKQLNGARIGIQSWVNTAGVWQRGILQQDYGVDLKSIEWVRESPEEGEGKQGPNWARITQKPRDRVLEQMLASGDIAAMMLPRPPELHPEEMQRIGRLFPNYVADEQGYYARTRLFPIMHVMVIKNALLSSHPGSGKMVSHWVQAALDAFVERQRSTNGKSIPWKELRWSEQQSHLGPHAWPAGVEANRKELEALITYALQQGIINRRVSPEELFQFNGKPLVESA